MEMQRQIWVVRMLIPKAKPSNNKYKNTKAAVLARLTLIRRFRHVMHPVFVRRLISYTVVSQGTIRKVSRELNAYLYLEPRTFL